MSQSRRRPKSNAALRYLRMPGGGRLGQPPARHAVVLIGATRTGHGGPYLAAGLPVVEVHGVDEAAAEEILRVKAGPLLLVMGGKDHTVPEAITKSTLKQYWDSSSSLT